MDTLMHLVTNACIWSQMRPSSSWRLFSKLFQSYWIRQIFSIFDILLIITVTVYLYNAYVDRGYKLRADVLLYRVNEACFVQPVSCLMHWNISQYFSMTLLSMVILCTIWVVVLGLSLWVFDRPNLWIDFYSILTYSVRAYYKII